MKFSLIISAASLAHFAVCATLPTADNGLASSDAHSLERRAQYSISTLDDLQEEAEGASQQQIDESIDYLLKIWAANGWSYALMGGIAMQKYGMPGRTTQDSDMAISAGPALLLNAVRNDNNIQYPSATSAASGTSFLFVNIGGQQVESDIFTDGGDQTPSLEGAVNIGGYQVISILELVKGKCKALREKDITDVIWLAQNKASQVRSVAGQITKQIKMQCAQAVKISAIGALDDVCSALDIDPADVD